MRRVQHAFRVQLEQEGQLSPWTVRRYVTAAGHLLAYCEREGLDLERGEVPATLLVDFGREATDARMVRGATLFCRFLIRRGVPLEGLDVLHDELELEEVERFLVAAREQPEPYATLIALLVLSGVSATELRGLRRADVIEREGRLWLRSAAGEVWLCDTAQRVLQGYLAGCRGEHAAESELLFPSTSKSGRPIGASTITTRSQRCMKEAGLRVSRLSALSGLYEAYFAPTPSGEEGEGAEADGDELALTPELSGLPADEMGPDLPSLPNDDDPGEGSPEPHPEPHRAEEPMSQDDEDDRDHGERRREPLRPRHRSRPARPARAQEVDRLLPRQGVIFIRHRMPDGHLVYCGSYSVTEVAPEGSIEPYIFKYLAPNWGGGEYLIYLTAKMDVPRVTVHVAEPIGGMGTRAGVPAGPPMAPQGQGHPNPEREHVHVLTETIKAVDELRSAVQTGGSPPIETIQQLARLEVKLEQLLQRDASLSGLPGLPGAVLGGPPLPAPERDSSDRFMEFLLDERKELRGQLTELRGQLKDLADARHRGDLGEGGDRLKIATSVMRDYAAFQSAARDLATEGRGVEASNRTDKALEFGKSVLEVLKGVSVAAPPPRPPSRSPKKKKGRRREEPARRPAALPEEVPSTFPTLAAVLDRAVEEEESGQEIVDALVGALASLASPPSPWGPFVRETAQKLYANDREGALTRLRAILAALVHDGHLRRVTASFVIAIAEEHWDNARRQILESFQEHLARQQAAEQAAE